MMLSNSRFFFAVLMLALSPSSIHAQKQATPSVRENQASDQARSVPDIDADKTESEQIEARIEDAIRQEPDLASASIAVKVTEKGIQLSGIGTSEESKRVAVRIALAHAGGRPVSVSGIKVKPNRPKP